MVISSQGGNQRSCPSRCGNQQRDSEKNL